MASTVGGLFLLLAAAGCGEEDKQARSDATGPKPLTFVDLKQRIPGAVQTSNAVVVEGHGGPYPAKVEGPGEPRLQINRGEPTPAALVAVGDRMSILATAPQGFAQEHAVIVTVGDRTAVWRITSLDAQPPPDFTFRPKDTVDPGSTVFSEFIAPDFYAPGTLARVEGEGRPRLVTMQGRFTEPVPLDPGQILQLIVEAPPTGGAVREVTLRIGERRTTWRIETRG